MNEKIKKLNSNSNLNPSTLTTHQLLEELKCRGIPQVLLDKIENYKPWIPCKHLIHDIDKFPQLELITITTNSGHSLKCWKRSDPDGEIQLVQFCSKHSNGRRMYWPEKCYNGKRDCYEV